MHPATRRNYSLDTSMQLAAALRFYATATFYTMVGDQKNISASSVCRIVSNVSDCTCKNLLPKFIKMPEANKLDEIKREFFDIAGLPGVYALTVLMFQFNHLEVILLNYFVIEKDTFH